MPTKIPLAAPTLLGPQIPISTATRAPAPTVYAKRNQMERILAAPINAMPAAVGVGAVGTCVLTLQADQGQNLQINRLVIQAAGVNNPGGAVGATSPVANDGLATTFVSSIIVRNTTQLVRGIIPGVGFANVGAPAGIWSPFRQFTGQGQFAHQGAGLRLEAGETVVITLQNTSNIDMFAMAACPTVLDCDKGRPAYSGGWDASSGAAILAAAPQLAGGFAGFGPGGQISNNIPVGLAYPEAGIVDLSQFMAQVAWALQSAPVAQQNEPLETPNSAFLTQITLIDQSVCVTGLNPTAFPLAVPIGMFWAGTGGQFRNAPWCRLQNQKGTAGNNIAFNLNSVCSSAAIGTDALAMISAPFYPASGSKPPIGCV
jgi:hypothetical protein